MAVWVLALHLFLTTLYRVECIIGSINSAPSYWKGRVYEMFFFWCHCPYSDALIINCIKNQPLICKHGRTYFCSETFYSFSIKLNPSNLRISSVLSHALLILRISQILWHIHLIIFQGPMLLSDGCGCYPRSPFSATRPNFRPFQTQQRQLDNTLADNQRENESISNCRFFYWKKGIPLSKNL